MICFVLVVLLLSVVCCYVVLSCVVDCLLFGCSLLCWCSVRDVCCMSLFIVRWLLLGVRCSLFVDCCSLTFDVF